VLVAGDAGGFVNGFSAEGIYYAMVSGDLAAASIIDALSKGCAAGAVYRARWKAEIGAELEESTAIRRFLLADTRIDALVTAAREAAPIVDALGRWAAGAERYATFRTQVLLRSPLVGIVLGAILLRERFEATQAAVFQSEAM
jgi:flavin-dependent dehydrogenase